MVNKHNLLTLIATGAIISGASMNISKPTYSRDSYENKPFTEQRLTDTLQNNTNNKDSSFGYSPTALKRYDSWVDSTLNESIRDSSNSIIVTKADNKLYLIKNGKVDSEYSIDLGYNSHDDKQKEGDGCTPEGMYLVQEKLDSRSTSFYKAFLINYPNKEDKSKGKTGSAIEIHGNGGKGYDWTLGCMALSNEDIDEIFQHIKKGDRITIVRYASKELFP
jgi:murein L,D-transpeptidase YafK